MKQSLAIGLALVLSFAAPALAQTSTGGSAQQTNQGASSGNGLNAQGQAPSQPTDNSNLLIGGGLAGTAILIGALISHKGDNGPISP